MFSGCSPSFVIESPGPSPTEIMKTFSFTSSGWGHIYSLIQLRFQLGPKLTTEVSDKLFLAKYFFGIVYIMSCKVF